MAGRIAVKIADRLVEKSFVKFDEDAGQLTQKGQSFLESVGVDLSFTLKRRVFCRPCLDWSERRPHLAGAMGAAILRHALTCGWVERVRDERALKVTTTGIEAFKQNFDIDANA